MTRAAIFKNREPVNETVNSAPTDSFDEFTDKIGEIIEDIGYGICDVMNGMSDFINNLALDISCAGI
jgi:hypothetical protein